MSTSGVVLAAGAVEVVAPDLASLSYVNLMKTAMAKSTASQKQQQPQRRWRRRRQQHRCIKWWRMFLGGVGAALYADMHECRRISYPRVPQLGCAMRSGTQEQSRKAINMWRIFIDGAIPSTLSAFRFDNMRYQTKQKEQLVSRFNYAR